jgi:hypothetical protein
MKYIYIILYLPNKNKFLKMPAGSAIKLNYLNTFKTTCCSSFLSARTNVYFTKIAVATNQQHTLHIITIIKHKN